MKKIISLMLVLSFSFGCMMPGCVTSAAMKEDTSDATGEDTDKLEEAHTSAVVEGTTTRYSYSINESGIFYIGRNESLLMYYDYEADTSYVLCSQANCRHNDASCPAYVGDYYTVTGFACYGGFLYLMRQNSYDSDLELLVMDVDGQSKKTLASFETGDSSAGSWRLDSVSPFYYCGGHVLMKMSYLMVTAESEDTSIDYVYGDQLVMVHLATGDVTELTDILIENDEQYSMYFDAVSDEYAVYQIVQYESPYLEESEFYEQYGNTASYTEYYDEYLVSIPAAVTYWVVDLAAEESSVLWTEDVVPYQVTLGEDWYEYSTDMRGLYGISQGQIYFKYKTLPGWDSADYRLYDIETGKETPLTEPASPVSWQYDVGISTFGGSMYDSSRILLCYHGEDTFQLYLYSLMDGTMETIDAPESYSLYGVTEKRVIGGSGDATHFSWLLKEDYESGNIDKAVGFSLDW
ncbi:MAG: hypothetical protein LIO99_04090 [Clostridiales bacterium]|nr:hypothetical protein [Clostridiales bacterium]